MIGIINYGAGNLASVKNAFTSIGRNSAVFSDPESIMQFARIILPGVGSFRNAMDLLVAHGWHQAIETFAASGRPILGICLGMQLLMNEGIEGGVTKGLGLISGTVMPLQPKTGYRVPHVGWNTLCFKRSIPLFATIKEHVDYYFVHSYQCIPQNTGDVIASCDYGGEFVAAIGNRNVVGTQFHPEKSQPHGLVLLENFDRWEPDA